MHLRNLLLQLLVNIHLWGNGLLLLQLLLVRLDVLLLRYPTTVGSPAAMSEHTRRALLIRGQIAKLPLLLIRGWIAKLRWLVSQRVARCRLLLHKLLRHILLLHQW